jgi:hypothetical protein
MTDGLQHVSWRVDWIELSYGTLVALSLYYTYINIHGGCLAATSKCKCNGSARLGVRFELHSSVD